MSDGPGYAVHTHSSNLKLYRRKEVYGRVHHVVDLHDHLHEILKLGSTRGSHFLSTISKSLHEA